MSEPQEHDEHADDNDEFDPADFDLTPGEVAALDQYAAYVRDKPPIPVPYVLVFKLVNRYTRLKRLREIGAPFAEKELPLIEKALEELASFAINGEFVELPPRSE